MTKAGSGNAPTGCVALGNDQCVTIAVWANLAPSAVAACETAGGNTALAPLARASQILPCSRAVNKPTMLESPRKRLFAAVILRGWIQPLNAYKTAVLDAEKQRSLFGEHHNGMI